MKKVKFKILWMAFLPLLLVSCSKDDSEGESLQTVALGFTAGMEGDDTVSWSELIDRRIAVRAGDSVKTYNVSDEGALTSAAPLYLTAGASLTVDAWYPYNSGVKPSTVVVKAEQNLYTNYYASNLLEVTSTEVTGTGQALTFKHRTAKLVGTLSVSATDGIDSEGNAIDLTGASAYLLGLSGVETGTTVQMSNDFKAYIAPQTVAAGTSLMRVELANGYPYTYTATEDLTFSAGTTYTVAIEVEASTGLLNATFFESPTWVYDEEELTGNASGTDVDGNGSWSNNGADSVDGNSSSTEANGNASWTDGDADSVTGSSSSTTASGSDASWNEGTGESIDGTSSSTTPSGSASWTGTEETLSGTKTEVTE